MEPTTQTFSGGPPLPNEPPYLATLNQPQREAVEAVDGPVLVLAGAGTGKTRVLTTRLAHILNLNRAWPSQILCVTFTNKAAREMRGRVAALAGDITESMWLGTFHALGARMLRRHAELVGLRSSFTILDSDDQMRLLKQVIEAAGLDPGRWSPRVLMPTIQRWKDRGIAPDSVSTAEAAEAADGRLVPLYRAYQERLRAVNAADFGDLLLLCLELFKKNPDILAEYQRRFRYILVDEYQDTNVSQYLWLRLLAAGHKNICCVGDDDQSIYGWRGAEVGNILRFEQDFPGAAIIRLEQNYRSTGPILAAAGAIIANNEQRLGKTLWTEMSEGEPVSVCQVWDGNEEARTVADKIQRFAGQGHKLSEIAILMRAGFLSRSFEERFLTIGLPYRVYGGLRFYERQEIRDAVAYLRVAAQPADDLAFERVLNKPRRGIGDATLQAVHKTARAAGTPLYAAALQLCGGTDLPARARNALTRAMTDFERWRGEASGESVDQVALTETILDESGYTAMLQADKAPEAPGRLENLKELVRALGEFENLPGFLEHISLVMDNEDNSGDDQVTLMTLHAAKGLEFDTVFLPGWEEGLFPHQRAMDENGGAGLEEERRLAYVGLTRARKRALVSCAANRQVHGQWMTSLPSRFLSELPDEHVLVESEAGLMGNTAGGSGSTGGAGAWRGSGYDWGSGSWRRPSAASGGTVVEAAWENVTRPSKTGIFEVGERVFHQKFGYGSIVTIDQDKLHIAFEKAGDKTVVDSFVDKV
jgi:DNA helicase-2/ATP-dependent DNA helicase PcrA